MSVHKTSAAGAPFESVRAASLLGAGAFLLSERSHPDDEARFATDDLVRFGDNVSALAQGYARLARMEPAARVQLARARAAAYKRAFAPAAVFAAAGIGAS